MAHIRGNFKEIPVAVDPNQDGEDIGFIIFEPCPEAELEFIDNIISFSQLSDSKAFINLLIEVEEKEDEAERIIKLFEDRVKVASMEQAILSNFFDKRAKRPENITMDNPFTGEPFDLTVDVCEKYPEFGLKKWHDALPCWHKREILVDFFLRQISIGGILTRAKFNSLEVSQKDWRSAIISAITSAYSKAKLNSANSDSKNCGKCAKKQDSKQKAE